MEIANDQWHAGREGQGAESLKRVPKIALLMMQERRLSAEQPKNSSTLFSSWERKHNRTPSASPAFRQAGMTLTIQFPSTSEKFDNRITCYCLLIACFPTEVTPRNMLSLWPNVLGVPNLSWPPQLNRSQHTTAKDGCFCWCCAGSHIF